MSRADYTHWNEEADIIWWQEEGRHADNPSPVDPEWDDVLPRDAEDAHWDELSQADDARLLDMLKDESQAQWHDGIRDMLTDRGVEVT